MWAHGLLFVKACLIGIAIAAPVGPIGVLCIRKTLDWGLMGAIAVGLGAALADGVFGVIAAAGLSVVSQFLSEKSAIIRIVGGIFLMYLAYRELKRAMPSVIRSKNLEKSRLTLEVFFLTLSNPMTILAFISIFASLHESFFGVFEPAILILGIFIGSMCWWLTLGVIVINIRSKLPEEWTGRIKYLSILILATLGAVSVVSGLMILGDI